MVVEKLAVENMQVYLKKLPKFKTLKFENSFIANRNCAVRHYRTLEEVPGLLRLKMPKK